MDILIKSFHSIKEEPNDGEFCFILFKNEKSYELSVGGYNKKEKYFWADLGLGGMVYKAENVIAWKSFSEDGICFP